MKPLVRALLLAAVLIPAAVPTRPGAAFQEDPAVSSLLLEDFEAAALGSRPYLWKEQKVTGGQVTVGAEKSPMQGVTANKSLQFEYAFTAADGAVETGPAGQALPGSVAAVSMMISGDNSRNAVALRVRDRAGEVFEWSVPVAWTGWRRANYPLNPQTAARSGSRANGVLDQPLALEGVRLSRTPAGARQGKIQIDNLTAECRFARVTTLYDSTAGAKPENWKANRFRSVVGAVAETLVPRGGKDVPVLKLEYEYEQGTDSSVEFSRVLPAGDGHGTLIAEVFGDGSNNLLRFRMLDGAERPWQATWASMLVDWSGWKTLYLDTRTLRDPEGLDPTAMLSRFPIRFSGLLIDDCSASDRLPGVESGRQGEIYLGRLLFGAEK